MYACVPRMHWQIKGKTYKFFMDQGLQPVVVESDFKYKMARMFGSISVLVASTFLSFMAGQIFSGYTHEVNKKLSWNYGFELPLALAVLDILACGFCIITKLPLKASSRGCIEGIIISLVGHFKGSFLANFWFSLTNHRMSYGLCYLEPILFILLTKICMGQSLKPYAIMSLVLMSVGATCASGGISSIGSGDRNGIVVLLWIFFYSVRNIGIKHCQEEGITFRFRFKSLLIYLVTIGVLIMALIPTWHQMLYLTIVALIRCLCSAGCLYISADIVGKHGLPVLAIVNVWMYYFVHIIWVPETHFTNVWTSIAGVSMLLLGTYVLIHGLLIVADDTDSANKAVSQQEFYVRMSFLLFAGFVIGLLFYVFHPRISERDLHNLSYVGLERIMRKLLQSNTT